MPSVVSEVSALPVFAFVAEFSSLLGVVRASSTVSGEARSCASVAFFVGLGLVDRMLFSCVCVRGRSVQKDFIGHLFWVRCVHLCF